MYLSATHWSVSICLSTVSAHLCIRPSNHALFLSGIVSASKVRLERSLRFQGKNWITRRAEKRRRAVISYNIDYGVVVVVVGRVSVWAKSALTQRKPSQRAKERVTEEARETDRWREIQEENKGALSKFLSNSLLCWHHQSETLFHKSWGIPVLLPPLSVFESL